MIDDLVNLVLESGKKIIELKNSGFLEGEWKGTQFKAKADILVHDFLVNNLRMIAPDIPIVSEEDPGSWEHINSRRYFIIDPIDGTASFAQGYAGFVTQIALVEDGSVISSVICGPVSGDVYWAERNNGAYLNNKRLHITDTSRWKSIIDNYPEPRGITKSAFYELDLEHYIESGSISLKICKIADESADIFFKNVPVRQWDIAAPHLILEESGGILLNINGKIIDYSSVEYPGIVAANSEWNAKRLIEWYSNHMKKEDVP
jgi:3'(2'), 5'-bisphosphate nucleotidase